MMNSEKQKVNLMDKIKEVNWLDIIYLIIFASYIGYYYLGTTALTYQFPDQFIIVLRYILIAYTVIKYVVLILTQSINKKLELPFMVGLVIVSLLVVHFSGDIYILDLTLLCIAAKDISFQKIAIVYLIVAVEIQVIAYYCSTHGLAPNYIYNTTRGVRRSYGICYPTDYAAHILFILLTFSYVRGEKITVFEITAEGIISYIVYTQTLARNDFICSILLVILLLVYKAFPQVLTSKVVKYGVMSLSAVLALGIIVLTFMYRQDSSIMTRLDSLLSTRLSLGNVGFQNYGLSMFGQPIVEAGNGFGGGGYNSTYFFLDSSFVRILLKYGVVSLVAILSFVICLAQRACKTQKAITLILVLVVCMFATVEHHIVEIGYNPLLLLVFSKTCSREVTNIK